MNERTAEKARQASRPLLRRGKVSSVQALAFVSALEALFPVELLDGLLGLQPGQRFVLLLPRGYFMLYFPEPVSFAANRVRGFLGQLRASWGPLGGAHRFFAFHRYFRSDVKAGWVEEMISYAGWVEGRTKWRKT